MPTTYDVRPVLPFVTQIDGFMVQIKPYFNFYRWLDFMDFSDLDQSEAIGALELAIIDINAAIVTTYELATDAVALATDASATAIIALNDAAAAQSTADAAAGAAAGAMIYSDSHFVLPRMMLPLSGAGFGTFTVNTTMPLNGGSLLAGNGSECFIGLAMDAGNWRVVVHALSLASGPNVIIQNNGITILSFETYNATNLVQEFTADFVIAGAGRQQLTLLIAGRPAGNTTGYNFWCSYILFYKR